VLLTATEGRYVFWDDVQSLPQPGSYEWFALLNHQLGYEVYGDVLYNGPRWETATERAVDDFVRSGKGMVTIHGATYAFGGVEVRKVKYEKSGILEEPWAAFVQMIGCQWTEENLGHGKRHQFPVRITDRNHPVTKGLPGKLMADDELYHKVTVLPHAKVLATAYSAPDTNGTGQDEEMMWVVEYGQGRVCHTTLGHDCEAMAAPAFRDLLLRGAEWAATGQVK